VCFVEIWATPGLQVASFRDELRIERTKERCGRESSRLTPAQPPHSRPRSCSQSHAANRTATRGVDERHASESTRHLRRAIPAVRLPLPEVVDLPHRGGVDRGGRDARHRPEDEPAALRRLPLALGHCPGPRDRHPGGDLPPEERPGAGGRDGAAGHRRRVDLRRSFESNLAPVGRVLLSASFRAMGLRLREADGCGVSYSKWDVGGEGRPIGVFEPVAPLEASE